MPTNITIPVKIDTYQKITYMIMPTKILHTFTNFQKSLSEMFELINFEQFVKLENLYKSSIIPT